MMAPAGEVDPRAFGHLEAEVHALQTEVAALRKDVQELLALANRGRGGFWFGMTVISAASALAGFVAERFAK